MVRIRRDYFDDQEAESRVVRRFSSSVVKLNVATMRFEVRALYPHAWRFTHALF